ncbi:DegV family protein [Clostridium folliculivorans]|uniref:DegV family protein n=1 Tax=Clostridium folliculivorans TaxID=2886038 RepID=A0A9W6DCN0_9CLOT|nr:DegV family protein [Clostridium folliculivorans]GKU27167.1 DegV family protein [Clostridium folliculivorans]GKU31784.1 DegV family protein [Clostridium folliculivorans]
MEKIKIITDSTVDIPIDLLKKNDVEVLPLLINFGEESYLDGVEINLRTMLKRIEEDDALPTTAQVTPNRFYECYKRYLEEGYKIISVHLSSDMSGTYNSACIAKDMFDTEDIIVIDSKNVTSGLGIVVLKAIASKEKGMNIKEIEHELLSAIPHIKSALSFESLDNLVRGGRLSRTAGVIGSVLGIRLLLEVKQGKMSVMDKVRGSKKATKEIIRTFETLKRKAGEPVVLLHIENQDIYEPLKEYLNENDIEYIDAEVGCTVGIHSGPKACGLFFIEEF